MGIPDILDRREEGEIKLDFKSENGQLTGIRGGAEHARQVNVCQATQKPWGTEGVPGSCPEPSYLPYLVHTRLR